MSSRKKRLMMIRRFIFSFLFFLALGRSSNERKRSHTAGCDAKRYARTRHSKLKKTSTFVSRIFARVNLTVQSRIDVNLFTSPLMCWDSSRCCAWTHTHTHLRHAIRHRLFVSFLRCANSKPNLIHRVSSYHLRTSYHQQPARVGNTKLIYSRCIF